MPRHQVPVTIQHHAGTLVVSPEKDLNKENVERYLNEQMAASTTSGASLDYAKVSTEHQGRLRTVNEIILKENKRSAFIILLLLCAISSIC